MQKNEIKKLLKQITDIYPTMKLSSDAVAIWAECLRDFSYEKAVENLIKYAKKNRFFPTIADIRGVNSSQKHNSNYCEVTGRAYEFFVPPTVKEKKYH